jgi:two-component system chemotaxis response regulator CheB
VAGHDVIVIGASAGGVEALMELTRELPPDLQAAVLVVVHLSAASPSELSSVLARGSKLPVVTARHLAEVRHGTVYVAPPDRHLMADDGVLRLSHGPKENLHRPAIDVLFRSAAISYGPRVVGVVLTGNLDDGTAGLVAIKVAGGLAVVQDPEDAKFSGMPKSALRYLTPDHVVPLARMPQLLAELVKKPAGPAPIAEPTASGADASREIAAVEGSFEELQGEARPGSVSGFTCPECNGALWAIQEGELERFRCRTGHALSLETLLAAQSDATERALWTALRSLQERISLRRRLLDDAKSKQLTQLSGLFTETIEDMQRQARSLHELLLAVGNGHDVEEL